MAVTARTVAWRAIQDRLAADRDESPLSPVPRYLAGADVAFTDAGRAAVAVALVWDSVDLRIVEVRSARRRVTVPYIPTFLSFREGAVLLAAIAKLRHNFGVICFDGQGIAHPRRCGLATHLGVTLDLPSLGIAKSLLIGTHGELSPLAGSTCELFADRQIVGAVLRTRDYTKPVYVSVGHRIDLPSAVAVARAGVTRFRVPEPTRSADLLVAKVKRGEKIGSTGR